MWKRLVLLAALALTACPDDPEGPGPLDASVGMDAGRRDASAIVFPDAGAPDGEVPLPQVGYAEMERFEGGALQKTVLTGSSLSVAARVYIAGVTDAVGMGQGFAVELGFGPRGTDPASSAEWEWTGANYSGDADGPSAGDHANDRFATTLVTQEGAWDLAARVICATGCVGAPMIVDADWSTPAYVAAQALQLTVRAPSIGWCKLQHPPTAKSSPGSPTPVFGRVFAEGMTEAGGQVLGLIGEAGFGPEGSDPRTSGEWTWQLGTLNAEYGNDDEYSAAIAPDANGTYAYAWRFRIGAAGENVYCDLSGNSTATANDFDPGDLGVLEVTEPAPTSCRVQHPASGEALVGQDFGVYGRVEVTGVTNQAAASPDIVGQLGYGAAGTDGSTDGAWIWEAAEFNLQAGTEHEYVWAFAAPAEGSWEYAYRFSFKGGPWMYCDADGSANGYQVEQQGELTALALAAPWTQLRAPVSDLENVGSQFFVSGEVYQRFVTDVAGQGSGLSAEVGMGAHGSPPTAWTWVSAEYVGDAAGGGTVSNDVYGAWLTAPAVGSYDVGMRFTWNGSTYLTDRNGDTPFSESEVVQLFTAEASGAGVGWCNLQHPPSMTVAAGGTTESVYGQIWIDGVTPNAGAMTGVRAQVGWWAGDEDPQVARVNWVVADYNTQSGNNDEYMAVLKAPSAAGTYRYAYRFRYLGGWAYCNTAGMSSDPANAGVLTVQ